MESALKDAGVATDIAVRFAETDLMGVVHHSVYAVWLEVGRIAWLEAAGVPYAEIAAGGNHLAVTSLAAQYRTPARFDDVVRIVTRLQELRSRQVSFSYELRRTTDDALLATAATDHICVDLSGQMQRIPPQIWERVRAGADMLAAAAHQT